MSTLDGNKILSSLDCPEAIYDTTHKNVSQHMMVKKCSLMPHKIGFWGILGHILPKLGFCNFGKLHLLLDASLVLCIFGEVILWCNASLVHHVFGGMHLLYGESLVW